ncbi:MAG: hypothetical protein M3229_00350 [Actinomycetota bacterium]|nr:hypothetical protein [Thermoleophilia bacterium]MDQ3992087.1 hypothetical protein [Actinomycetota bacterium]
MRRAHLVAALSGAVLAVWVGRWALLELASYVHRSRPARAPLPRETDRPPGHMPGPFD